MAVFDFRMDSIIGLQSKPFNSDTYGYGDYESIVRISVNSGGVFEVRDLDEYIVASEEQIELLTWYHVWLVHDNIDLSYDMYIQGGSLFPQQTLLYEDALYRAGIGEMEVLTIFQSTGSSSQPFGNSDFYLDDIYIDYAGQNLESPVGGVEPDPTWAGWSVNSAGDVNTEGFLGWLNVENSDFVWSYSLSNFIFLPEGNVKDDGAWMYIFR
jgi:hypothetical protein